MEHIAHKMFYQVTKRFMRNGIFLAAVRTVSLRNFGSAVQAVLILP